MNASRPNKAQTSALVQMNRYELSHESDQRPAPTTTGQSASVHDAAKHFEVDQVTIRRYIRRGCPCLRPGRRGPGLGARLDLDAVATWLTTWRGVSNAPAGLSVEEYLQRIAIILLETVEIDHADICAEISREATAAVLLVVWRCCCRNFGRTYRLDEQPQAIRTLMSFL